MNRKHLTTFHVQAKQISNGLFYDVTDMRWNGKNEILEIIVRNHGSILPYLFKLQSHYLSKTKKDEFELYLVTDK